MEDNFNIKYVKVSRENPELCTSFLNLGYEYMKEVAPEMPLEVHKRLLNSILDKQTEKERWLIALVVNGEPFWFSLGFLDTGETENEMKILRISI